MRTNGQPSVNGDVYEAEFEEDGGGRAPPGALATVRGAGMMQTRTQYSTAVIAQVPRDLATTDAKGNPNPNTVLARVLREAAIAGEDFLYSMTFRSKDGPSTVEGVSIDGAMILARNFMNCACECEVVEEGPTHWIFKATFIDHETGFTEARLFRQNKKARSMKGDPERLLDIAFQIGQSKAKRNAIVRAMPTWLVDQATNAAKAAAAAKVKDLPKAIEDVTATFKSKFGVDVQRIEKYLSAPIAQWNARDIVRLRAVYKAIIERSTTVDNEFPLEEEAKPAAETRPVADEGFIGDAPSAAAEPKAQAAGGGPPAASPTPAATAPAAPPAPEPAPKVDAKAPTEPAPPPAETPKPKADAKPKSESKKGLARDGSDGSVPADQEPPQREPGSDDV